MQRLTPYAGIIAAVMVALAVLAFRSPTGSPVPLVATTTAPSLTVLPTSVATSSAIQDAAAHQAIAATTHPVAPTAHKKAVSAVASVSAPTPEPVASATPLPQSGNGSLDAAASTLRNALVNILCSVPAGSRLHAISGSGIIIDLKGIILTNAHIAQYFLLADKGVSCAIRTGSPAVDTYKAALIYLSPLWVNANPTVLTEALPSGTGEYDFALLAVTSGGPANASFPFIPLAATPPTTAIPVVIASYGAQFLQSEQVRTNLSPTIVFGSVKDIFTFGTNSIDVLDLGGSAAAQEGSSGGGVAAASGELVGTITTSTVTGSTDTRSLSAITASYIRAEFARETASTLTSLFAQPTAASIADFAHEIPLLESIITANLR